MSIKLLDESEGEMEKSLIEQYLNDQGYSPRKLQQLPDRVVKQLMREATKYASLKMEEIKKNKEEIEEGALHHNLP